VLRIVDLVIEYTQGSYVLRPIDGLKLAATDGELVILLGPSGCGKTTLLSCIASLLSPKSGTIHVDQTEVTALKGAELERYRRKTVGIIFQAFNLIPSLTSRENVAAPLRLAGMGRAEANRRADELLDRVGLADRARHRPASLSGGQQQRVAIARALAHDPPLILADEPTAHLDYLQVEEVLRLIRELAAPGRLVLVATHDDRFNPLADRVVELATRPASEDARPESITLGAGEVLFRQGEPSRLVYLVEEGEIELYRELADGGEELLTGRIVGEWFGELGPMLGLPRSATARAVVPSRLLGVGLAEFRRRWIGVSTERAKTADTDPGPERP
jgi:putative ABC transport system ATP-binding protein